MRECRTLWTASILAALSLAVLVMAAHAAPESGTLIDLKGTYEGERVKIAQRVENAKTAAIAAYDAALKSAETNLKEQGARDHEWATIRKGRLSPEHMDSVPRSNLVVSPNEPDFEKESPMLAYEAIFEAEGTYYLWMRCQGEAGGASLVPGYDGTILEPLYAGNFPYHFAWLDKYQDGQRVALDVAEPGRHTVNFWMCEDGIRFDQFVITAAPNFRPQE